LKTILLTEGSGRMNTFIEILRLRRDQLAAVEKEEPEAEEEDR